MLSRNCSADAASASPGLGMSSASNPTLITRLTPLTSTFARSGWSGRNSITSPGMPRHIALPLHHVQDDPRRLVDRRGDGLAQFHAVLDAAGLAANHEDPARLATEHVENA